MKVCLDSNCVIYLVEKNPIWAPKLLTRLAAARVAGDALAVSDLARLECLIGPPSKWRRRRVLGLSAVFFEPSR